MVSDKLPNGILAAASSDCSVGIWKPKKHKEGIERISEAENIEGAAGGGILEQENIRDGQENVGNLQGNLGNAQENAGDQEEAGAVVTEENQA